MKGLLVVGSPNPNRSNLKWTGIVLIPVGVTEYSDPYYVIYLSDSGGIRFGQLSNDALKKLRVAKEVDLSEEMLSGWNVACTAWLEFKKKEEELKNFLLKEKVDWSCDAMSFLDYGSELL